MDNKYLKRFCYGEKKKKKSSKNVIIYHLFLYKSIQISQLNPFYSVFAIQEE